MAELKAVRSSAVHSAIGLPSRVFSVFESDRARSVMRVE